MTSAQKRPPLVFSHANGFPAPCYAKMFSALAADFDIRYLPRLAHNPAYPVTDSWPELTQELIDFIEQGPHPVIGVGHSLGGFLSFLAAARRPDLFSALVLLDAPVIEPYRASALHMTKLLGFIDRVTPARATRDRRRTWATAAEAIAHFRSRKLFRRFDPDCLADYVRYGMVSTPEGLALWFDPAIESRIYCTIPHRAHRLLPELTVPAGFIGGRQSVELRLFGLGGMRGRLRMRPIDGGHLFPFEHPLETATALREMVQALRAPGD
ncbi:MAG: alpha/beta hydrolase [Sterolibacterium sp.]|jgi:pimeloyl-ACP methyl ester carboxylesterase|nr:alpha/beta hydrolase [Sterolibacterium sp.]